MTALRHWPSTLDDRRLAETTNRRPRSLALVVLAAGKGKRLKSVTPKVLHPICGRPALWHVLQAGLAAKPTKVIVVVGHGADDVRAEVASWKLTPKPVFVEQGKQLGTGHAVQVAERAVGRVDDVLVMGGDYDPVTGDDVKRLVASHRRSNAAATIASTVLDDPGGYGRVVRRGSRLVEVVEDLDATPEVRAIREVSIVLFAFRRRDLFAALPLLDRRNRQREYYLNRVIPAILAAGQKVNAVTVDTGGAMGLNSRVGLAAVEAVVRERVNARHMANGVTLVDPRATYIDVDVEIGADGRFGYDDLDAYGTDDGVHFAFLVRAGERLAGFALATRGSPATDDPEHLDVAEFFILRRHRRTGLGREAAFQLFDRLRGRWIVRVSNANPDALPFWRSAVRRYTDGAFTESQHPGGAHGWRVFSFDSAIPVGR